VVVAYHERTKHHFHRYAASLGYMDWATQPDPFRRYAGAALVRLPLPQAGRPLPYWQLDFCVVDEFKNATSMRELISNHMISAQIAQAQVMARKCLEKSR
jgi:hypothetical protein